MKSLMIVVCVVVSLFAVPSSISKDDLIIQTAKAEIKRLAIDLKEAKENENEKLIRYIRHQIEVQKRIINPEKPVTAENK